MAILPGQRRAQRARKYGNTVESVDAHTWKVQWDDGVVTVEKSGAMRVETATAGREQPAPAPHSAAASTNPDRNHASYVDFNFTESQPQWPLLSGTPGSAGTDVVPPSVGDSVYTGSMPSNDGNFGSSNGSSAPSAGTESYDLPSLAQPLSDSSDSDDDDTDATLHPVVAAGGELAQLLTSLVGTTTKANGVT